MTARDLIEAGRNFTRKSNRLYVEGLRHAGYPAGAVNEEVQRRGNVVLDSYLTGAAEALKLLAGDRTPEPFSEDYDHEKRLDELLQLYGSGKT
jgi:hypothetical protein